MANKLATKSDSALAGYAEHLDQTGDGFEGQTKDDLAIPFIFVLQGLSPQLETVDGAKPGKLFNSVTEELYDSVEFVPAMTEHFYIEWIPREQGGGFVGVHGTESEVVQHALAGGAFGKWSTEYAEDKQPIGNDLIDTYQIYTVLCSGEEPLGMAVLSMTSTKIPVYRKFNTARREFRAKLPDGSRVRMPLFSHLCRLSSVKQTSNKGDFYNFKIDPAHGNLQESLLGYDDPRVQAAISLNEMVKGGLARVDHSATKDEDSIPF